MTGNFNVAIRILDDLLTSLSKHCRRVTTVEGWWRLDSGDHDSSEALFRSGGYTDLTGGNDVECD